MTSALCRAAAVGTLPNPCVRVSTTAVSVFTLRRDVTMSFTRQPSPLRPRPAHRPSLDCILCVRRSLGRRRRSRRSIKSPIQQLMASCKPHRQQLRSVCAFSCSARFSVEYRLYQFVIITATCTVYHSLTFHSGL